MNRLGGDFRFQHLPVPFEVYADGIDLVIFEEFGSGATALHLQEKVARDALMRDPAYRAAFRKDYESQVRPPGLAPRLLRRRHRGLPRRLGDREVVRPGRRRARRPAPGRRVPRPGPRARHRPALADHDLQPPPRGARKIAREPGVQMGFSDAGAHLRNMAFYNFGLRLLKHVRDAETAGSRS